MILASEQGLSVNQLCENAANRPEINSLTVVSRRKHNLGGSVPSRHYVHGQCHFELSVVVLARGDASSQTKIANLQVTVRVDQQIARLNIAMHDARRVKEEEATEKLVHEVLVVRVVKLLLRHDQLVEVGLHLFGNDIDVLVVCFMGRLENVYESNDIFMFEEF